MEGMGQASSAKQIIVRVVVRRKESDIPTVAYQNVIHDGVPTGWDGPAARNVDDSDARERAVPHEIIGDGHFAARVDVNSISLRTAPDEAVIHPVPEHRRFDIDRA